MEHIEVAAFLVSHCIDFANKLPEAGKHLTPEFALTDMVVEDVAAYIRLFEHCCRKWVSTPSDL